MRLDGSVKKMAAYGVAAHRQGSPERLTRHKTNRYQVFSLALTNRWDIHFELYHSQFEFDSSGRITLFRYVLKSVAEMAVRS